MKCPCCGWNGGEVFPGDEERARKLVQQINELVSVYDDYGRAVWKIMEAFSAVRKEGKS